MKTLPSVVLTAALALAPWRAHAADLRVAYDVDVRALRQAGGDARLTFEVYGDAACASIPLVSQTVPVGDVDLIEKIATVRIGDEPKRPPIARLVEALPLAAELGGTAVRVRGAGIVPIGGECQALAGTDAAAAAGGSSGTAQNVFVDGFTTVDQEMPSTPSGNDPAASIARLEVGPGNHVVFASIVWSGNPLDFSGIVTCHLVPPNGPNSKAEFIGNDTTTGTLVVQTTNVGAGTVDFRCSDASASSHVGYRFVQLTAIEVPRLARTNLLP